MTAKLYLSSPAFPMDDKTSGLRAEDGLRVWGPGFSSLDAKRLRF